MPASLVKLVTLAAAADQLGWDYTYETQVVAAGTISAGSLDGDLLVVGGGDPSIDDWDGFATTLFRGWADRLKELGVRVVTGRIVGDDNAFDDEPFGSGWAWDDLSASYATGVGALQFNQNTARLSIAPGAKVGDKAEVALLPGNSGIVPVNLLMTGAPGDPFSITTRRLPGSARLEIRGTVPLGGGQSFRNVSVDNSTLYFVTALRDALVAAGIEVRGPAVDIDDIDPPTGRDGLTPLLVHRSQPLSAVATTMMKNSQNLYAETLLKTLGVAAGVGAGEGSSVIAWMLDRWGVPEGGFLLADGSGLSRYNLATAEALVSVLSSIYGNERLREPFEATLPVAGKDGTLAGRLAGTVAEGVTRAKTGSFSNARSLAGYTRTVRGESLAFCIIANNFGPSGATVEQTIDSIVVRLAQFSR
jgi:D-alanyl-D-alanine carboxypeptidase/D-alanyl-D-alanine-endopeptidase (penicillin-binding protein 4)